MSNKERLALLNSSYFKLLAHCKTIGNCCQQTDDLLVRLEEIKQKLICAEDDVSDDFKEIHEAHIQNTQYIEELELYEKESINFKRTIDGICGKPLSDPIWFQHLKKKYLNQVILYELYRQGRFKAAQLFIEEAKLKEPKQDKEKFIKLHHILHAMDKFNIQPALNWITENEKKEDDKKDDNDNNDDDDNKQNENNDDSKDKDINFTQKYSLSKYADILRFLLHRDKFLHISAVGTKQEMQNYMRQQLEKLRHNKYNNQYSGEIINNLHYEASSIAYYIDDWKLLYFLKIFPNKKLNQIPVQLQSESFEKYCNVINDDNNDDNNGDGDDVEMKNDDNQQQQDSNEMDQDDDDNRKRKTMNDTNEDEFDANLNINNNKDISPRKKRKISDKTAVNYMDDKYNAAHLCPNQEYLTYDQKAALYKSFEFTTLIESVWNLSRKAFITAFINVELDLPAISGLQTCIELAFNIFPKFKELSDDISVDFDDMLTLYKDFNKERHIRSRAPFANSLIAHQHANNSDDDNTAQNGVSLTAVHNASFKWEDYDTLDDESSSEEEEEQEQDEIEDVSSQKDARDIATERRLAQIRSRELPHVPSAMRSTLQTSTMNEIPFNLTKMNQRNDSDDDKKQQKGRFRIHSDDSGGSKMKGGLSNIKGIPQFKYRDNEDQDETKDNMEEDENDNDDDGDEWAYGNYDELDDGGGSKEERDIDGYIGYMNRKEFKLDMKKKRIIRRSKNKEYKDRMEKYGTAEFLYNQIQPFIDQPNKKKRSHKHKFTRPTTLILSNRSRTHRYDSRGVQRPHSLPSSSQRHRSHRYHSSQSASPTSNAPISSLTHLRIQPALHRIPTNTTPPPPSDSDAAEDAFMLHRNLNIPQQLNIPHLHRPTRSTSSQSNNANDNENDDVYAHIISHPRRSHQHRRLYQNIASSMHRAVQQQFSPPPSNHAPLLLGSDNLLAPRTVNENDNEDNTNDDSNAGGNFRSDLDFHADLSMLNPSLFASRSSSPLSSQLTGMTLEHLSMTNNASSTNNASVDDDAHNDDMAAQALLLLKNLNKSQEHIPSNSETTPKKENTENKNNSNDKEEADDDSKMDDKSKSDKMEMDHDNETDISSSSKSIHIMTPQTQKKQIMASIDWENESDSSEDDEIYLTRKDRDLRKKEEERLKISMKMGDDFKIPSGYLSHSIFVCPIQTDYVPDPQTKLGCGHLISYNAFVRLQNIRRQRDHGGDRNRTIKINCPICDQSSDIEKDIRYVYLGRFPNLRVDQRFNDILDKKDLDQNATKWIPGATQINGQE